MKIKVKNKASAKVRERSLIGGERDRASFGHTSNTVYKEHFSGGRLRLQFIVKSQNICCITTIRMSYVRMIPVTVDLLAFPSIGLIALNCPTGHDLQISEVSKLRSIP